MSFNMMELCEGVLKTAKKAGAENCRVGFSKRRFVEVEYRERKPETVKEATTQSIDVEIFVNGRYSSQNTADLRKETLNSFVKNVIETAKLLEEDPYRSLPDPNYYENRSKINLKLSDPDYTDITAEKRHEMAKNIEAACLDQGGDKVISVTSSVYDDFNEELFSQVTDSRVNAKQPSVGSALP